MPDGRAPPAEVSAAQNQEYPKPIPTVQVESYRVTSESEVNRLKIGLMTLREHRFHANMTVALLPYRIAQS